MVLANISAVGIDETSEETTGMILMFIVANVKVILTRFGVQANAIAFRFRLKQFTV